MERDHKTIWLSPACERCDPERLWCQDDVFEPCEQCGRGPSQYSLIDADSEDQISLSRQPRDLPEHVARAGELLDVLRDLVHAIGQGGYDAELDRARDLLSDLGTIP